MKLFIKNMVCDRCRMAVKQELERLQVPFRSIELGEAELEIQPTEKQIQDIRQALARLGFELIEDKTARIISKIKNTILSQVRNPDSARKLKLSVFLSEALNKDYATLSNLFSGVEGITIEQYHILQKIEWVKELLVYNELSLSEISHRLHYSSVQHLSSQFKKVTGLTPSHFKTIGHSRRQPLDWI